MNEQPTLTPSLSRGERGSEWRVDDGGGVRTPAGMLVFCLTPMGDLEILDRKLKMVVTLTARRLLELRAEWMSRS